MNNPTNSSEEVAGRPAREKKWTCEELERLYQKALDAVEAVASDLNSATQALINDAETPEPEQPTIAPHQDDLPFRNADSPVIASSWGTEGNPRATAGQVVEALLFVGGNPLTAKTICNVLRGEFGADFVDQAIDEINQRYRAQKRPYEVRLGDGGYRMVLRSEFEPLRNRVYGFGPRQVRLTQETLDILSIVAYRQPITRSAIEEIIKRSAGSHLRQLLLRELILLERPDADPNLDAVYRTSSKFLHLFGLERLDDLPQIEDLSFK